MTFSYDEDGTYTVVATKTSSVLSIDIDSVFTKTVVLLGGNVEKVTIK